MFEPISNMMAAIAVAFTAPLLAALGTAGNMPPSPDGMMQSPPPAMYSGQMNQGFGGQQPNFQGSNSGSQDGIFHYGQPNFQKDGPGFQQGQPNFQRDGANYQMGSGDMNQGRPLDTTQGRPGSMPGGSQAPRDSMQFKDSWNPEQRQRQQWQNLDQALQRSDVVDRDSQGGNNRYGGNQEDMMRQEEERQKRMEAEQEEMQKRMEKQQLAQMKRMFSGGMMEKGIVMMKKSIAKLQKQGISVPGEYLALISSVEEAMKVIKGATEMTDEVSAAMEILQDKSEDLREIGPRIGMLSEWPRIIKSADSQLVRVRKQFNQAKTRAKKSMVDISEIEAKIEAELSQIEKVRDDLKIQATKADVEFGDIMDSLREDVFEAIGDLQNDINILQNISDIGSELKKVDSMLKNFDARAVRLQKAKKNTSRLSELIVEAKKKRDEVKNIISKSGFGLEALFNTISDGQSLLREINQEFATLENQKTEIDNQFNFSNPFDVDTKPVVNQASGR